MHIPSSILPSTETSAPVGIERWALNVQRWALGVERSALGVERSVLGVERWALRVERSLLSLFLLLSLSGCLSPSRRPSDGGYWMLDVDFPPVHGQYADSATPVALYLVRDRSLGAIPGDMPVRKDMRVELDVPPWCRGASVLDLFTGQRVTPAQAGRQINSLPALTGFQLLWIDGISSGGES